MKRTRNFMLLAVVLVVVVLVAIFGAFYGSYNGLAVAREQVQTSQGNIQTQLQRRSDLIPNLVNTVKGVSEQEKEIIQSVSDARAQLAGASGMQELASANDALSSALSRLLVVVESYPEIQSSAAYISLMDELAGTENRISVARSDYNDAVQAYNSKLVQLPQSMFAGIMGFEKAEYFTASEAAQTPPAVDFGG